MTTPSPAIAQARNAAMWGYLSILIGFGVSILTFGLPLLFLWVAPLILRDSTKDSLAREHTTQALNQALTGLIYLVPGLVITFVTFGLGAVFTVGFNIAAIVFLIIATTKASAGERYHIPAFFALPLVKP